MGTVTENKLRNVLRKKSQHFYYYRILELLNKVENYLLTNGFLKMV